MREEKERSILSTKKNFSFHIGYVLLYIYIYIKVEEAVIHFSNSSKYLDQSHPSWTDQT